MCSILFSGTSSHVQILVLLLYLWELQGSNFAIWQPWERADIINMGVCESEKGKGGRNNEATFVRPTCRSDARECGFPPSRPSVTGRTDIEFVGTSVEPLLASLYTNGAVKGSRVFFRLDR